MEIAILFWALVLAAGGYAVMLGGWEGKATTGIFIAASIATVVSDKWLDISWHQTNLGVFFVDSATFGALYWVAALSARWWPLWVAAFQLNSVAAHVATMISPHFTAILYQQYAGLWAIPCVLAMVIGIYRDRLWDFRYALA